jgi:hypothetical protein
MLNTSIELAIKRKQIAEEGISALKQIEEVTKKWKNADKIKLILDDIHTSKLIIYSMYNNASDSVLINIMSTYNKLLHDLLEEVLVNNSM